MGTICATNYKKKPSLLGGQEGAIQEENVSSHLVCHVAGLNVLIQLAKGELLSGTQLLERRLVNVIHVVTLLRND
jgi:hypothetical protein